MIINGVARKDNYMPAYLALISNNANERNAVLGNGTRNTMYGLGKAFSLYSKNGGESIDLSNLEKCENFAEIFSSMEAKREMLESNILFNMIKDYGYTYHDEFQKYTMSESDDNTTKTVNVEITGDVTKKIVRFIYSLTRAGYDPYTYYKAQLTFNGVTVANLSGSGNKETSASGDLFINLSDYGITEPGTYPLVLTLYSYYSGMPSTGNITLFICNE